MHHVFLGIGGNIGKKQQNFGKVKLFIESEIGKIKSSSSVYETPPLGFFADDNFWNQVFLVDTRLEPDDVLYKIQEIEARFGRKRDAEFYVSREMDIDVLYYDELSITTDRLIIPHPRIAQRLFVLVPLAEIAPGYQHPVLKLTNRQLLEQCQDDSNIKRLEF